MFAIIGKRILKGNSVAQLLLQAVLNGCFHLETAAKLLISLEGILSIFSKCSLRSLTNQIDFDSAIRRFDPSRPSH
jgi:hypothetical protein